MLVEIIVCCIGRKIPTKVSVKFVASQDGNQVKGVIREDVPTCEIHSISFQQL